MERRTLTSTAGSWKESCPEEATTKDAASYIPLSGVRGRVQKRRKMCIDLCGSVTRSYLVLSCCISIRILQLKRTLGILSQSSFPDRKNKAQRRLLTCLLTASHS